MGQCCATERTRGGWAAIPAQHPLQLSFATLPFLHGSPKCGKFVKYGAVSRLFMCELRRKVMSSIGKGGN